MKRLVFFSLAMFSACGGSSTEPAIPLGMFNLYSVNGVRADAPFDASSCANWYESVSYLNLLSGGGVSVHIDTHQNCRSGENIYEDVGTFAVSGSTVSMKLRRASVAFPGTVSANNDTLTFDFRDVWNPDIPTTAKIAFVRNR
jgi:hypothetical protein